MKLTIEQADYLDNLDRALASGDIDELRKIDDDHGIPGTLEVTRGGLQVVTDLILYLVDRIEYRSPIVPVGYQRILEQLFDIAEGLIDGDVERYRSFGDVVSSRTDLNLPWDRLRLNKRGVAVLYNFVPFADTGSSVASKRIRDLGAEVDVISCSSIGKKHIDISPWRVCAPYLRNCSTLPMGPAWASWKPQLKFIQKALEEIVDAEKSGVQYDFIYTRAMWVPSHYVGALHKLENPAIEWIAEFSDPLSLDVEGLARAEHPPQEDSVFDALVSALEKDYGKVPEVEQGIFRMAELLAYAFADEIVFTNRLQMETMIAHIQNRELRQRVFDRATVSNHPTLPRVYYEAPKRVIELDSNKINLGYFGQFYATRGLGDLTRAMGNLSAENLDAIRLHVFTAYVPEDQGGRRPLGMNRELYSNYVQRTVDAVGSSGLEAQVELHPALPYLEFLKALDDFDYLIVNDAESGKHHLVNPFLPSKYGDYRGSVGKVWALCERGSCLDRSTASVKTRLGDSADVQRFLSDMLNRFRGDGTRSLGWPI